MAFEGCWKMKCVWYPMIRGAGQGEACAYVHRVLDSFLITRNVCCRHQCWAAHMWGPNTWRDRCLIPGTGITKPEAISSPQLQKQGRHCIGRFCGALERRESGVEVKELSYWHQHGSKGSSGFTLTINVRATGRMGTDRQKNGE